MSEVAGRVHGPVVPEGDVLPDDPRRIDLDRAAAVIADLVAGRRPRGVVPPIDSRTGRTGSPTSLARSGRSGGRDRQSTERSPVGSGRHGQLRAVRRRARPDPVEPSGAVPPGHRGGRTIGGYGGDAWGSAKSALERKRTLVAARGSRSPFATARARAGAPGASDTRRRRSACGGRARARSRSRRPAAARRGGPSRAGRPTKMPPSSSWTPVTSSSPPSIAKRRRSSCIGT